jgi:hypothetical protein
MTTTTTALSYNLYVTQIATMAVLQQTLLTTGTSPNSLVTSSDPNFQAIIPQMLNYAELRIQRDLDFLATQTASSSYTLTSSSNTLSVPTTDFVTVQTIYINNNSGGENTLTPVSKEFIRNVYGSSSYTAIPQYFAVYGNDFLTTSAGPTNQIILFGPWPNTTYTATVTGTTRQPTLNNFASSGTADTVYTFISQNLPDLLIMASMIYISAYQRNFGRESDDPAMAQSYENQYNLLLKGATVEEARKKFQAGGWTSYSPAIVASPTR